jgi:zinc D-Ala-D-Ala carboxypeptidase
VVNSQYRDPIRNIIGGGVDSSYHMNCQAVDFFIPGVNKSNLIAFAKRNPEVGGLGCYPGRQFIHVDVRDRPRGWKKPITFSGC